MLAKFQSLYPTSSLTTELLEIHHGKFIVRSSVEIKGVTRATGMAAADTIEEAEDRSRARALMVLAMKAEEPQAEVIEKETTTSPKPSLEVLSNRSLTTAATAAKEHPKKETESPPETQTPVSETPPTSSPEETKIPISETPPTSSPQETEIPISETPPIISPQETEIPVSETPPISSPQETETLEAFSGEDYSNIYSQEFDTPLPIPTYNEREIDTPVENPDIPFDSPHEEEATPTKTTSASKSSTGKTTKKTTKTTTTKRKKKAEPIDLSDVIAKTDVQMERLRWTPQQGREYLIQTYNKRGRTLLTEEELLDFLQHLESIPTPQPELSEADPLAGF
ncbi:MAG: hypothetical protein AAF757_05095 [Cyanobacteria bacterium P01_D01_bin.116]